MAGLSQPQQPKPQPKPKSLQGMFADGNSLLRAIVASEVLGQPVALRENDHWSRQQNEPSI